MGARTRARSVNDSGTEARGAALAPRGAEGRRDPGPGAEQPDGAGPDRRTGHAQRAPVGALEGGGRLQKNDPSSVPKRRLWFYETIKRFEADHKDIKLQYQTANWNVATQTFIAASQAGNPPESSGRRARTTSRSPTPASWPTSGSSSTTSGTTSTRPSCARRAP